jgi:hypothetical protein
MTVAKRVKSLIKSAFPSGVTIYRKASRAWRNHSLASVFSEIYRKNLWQNSESVSGRGSTLERTDVIRYRLPLLLQELKAQTLFDAACGDFNWMRHTKIAGAINYIGADIVPDLIAQDQRFYAGQARAFLVLDITRDRIPTVDIILCRDCLNHLSFRHARDAIANFKKSGSTYLLSTTHANVEENRDISSGGWRPLNLQLPPFSFPQPVELIVEDNELGKCLGLWQLEDLY